MRRFPNVSLAALQEKYPLVGHFYVVSFWFSLLLLCISKFCAGRHRPADEVEENQGIQQCTARYSGLIITFIFQCFRFNSARMSRERANPRLGSPESKRSPVGRRRSISPPARRRSLSPAQKARSRSSGGSDDGGSSAVVKVFRLILLICLLYLCLCL